MTLGPFGALLVLIQLALPGHADVVFTAEPCDRASFGLRPIQGDASRYKQCGPSAKVWIVPCAPHMSFDPVEKVCKETEEPKQMNRRMEKGRSRRPVITTPHPHPVEFVFSTVRPKRPRIKGKGKRIKTSAAPTKATTLPLPQTTYITEAPAPLMPSYQQQLPSPAFPPPGSQKATTFRPEYTVKYNGENMTEEELLRRLVDLVKAQKASAAREKVEKEERQRIELERRRLEEERRLEQERIEMEQRIRQEEDRIEAERMEKERLEKKRADEERRRIRMEKKKKEEERKKAEAMRRKLEEEERLRKEEELEQRRLAKERREEELRMQLERAEQERAEAERRLLLEEAERKAEKEKLEQMRRIEEAKREQERLERLRKEEKLQAERDKEELMRRERERAERIRQEMERQLEMEKIERQMFNKYATTIVPDFEIIRFPPQPRQQSNIVPPLPQSTTPAPWVTSENSWRPPVDIFTVERTTEAKTTASPRILDGCIPNGDCPFSYDGDHFCAHPDNPSLYLQCAPMIGRRGRWTTRRCPETLLFSTHLGRCEKDPYSAYNPNQRVVIPSLPKESQQVEWTGNREILTVTPVYAPQSRIYSTIDSFPQDLLPVVHPIHPGDLFQSKQSTPEFYDYDDLDLSKIHPLFPRVQPSFFNNLLPFQPLREGEKEKEEDNILGAVFKPFFKKVALKQTKNFLDRVLSDEEIKRMENEKDRLREEGTSKN